MCTTSLKIVNNYTNANDYYTYDVDPVFVMIEEKNDLV